MSVHEYFTVWDWLVLGGYLLLTTWVGHALRGKQATMKDFFLAGRSLPWPAVSASIIATEISALTFVGLPGMVYAMGGDFTYLQWALGSIIARVIVGMYFVKAFYEKEIYSPYDFMGSRLGVGAKRLATGLFYLGSILGQSVRVLVTALVLQVVTPLSFEVCIVVITFFAVVWSWMGGLTTVIWTDVMQFFLFIFGGLLGFVWLISLIDGGVAGYVQAGSEAMKFRLLNLSTDPAVGYTLWVALLAMPFQNLAAFGTDQLNAQRMFCCRDASDARKAIIWSCVGQVVTVLMLMVGAALFVFYQQNPPTEQVAEAIAGDNDRVFPVWIITNIPPGLAGLILAGAFAAAISSLDSILAALAQTSLSLTRLPETLSQTRLVWMSRVLVLLWGILLCGFAISLNSMRGDINMVNLAFGMVAYTYGPMLGILLYALWAKSGTSRGLVWGAVLSVLLTIYIRQDLYQILINLQVWTESTALGWEDWDWAAWLPIQLSLNDAGTVTVSANVNFAWLYPITTGLTFFAGMLGDLGRGKRLQT